MNLSKILTEERVFLLLKKKNPTNVAIENKTIKKI